MVMLVDYYTLKMILIVNQASKQKKDFELSKVIDFVFCVFVFYCFCEMDD